jgi:mono/diheme cytochrome c family protein
MMMRARTLALPLCGALLFGPALLPPYPCSAAAEKARPQTPELRPGLVAAYRSVADRDAALTRVDLKPAFYLGQSSPHPRLPPGRFRVVWSGVLHVKDPGPLTFDAYAGGEVSVTVDGVAVLSGRGESELSRIRGKQPLDRKPGHYSITVRFLALEKVPARLQLWWQGPTFAREPIPAWHFRHRPADLTPEAKAEEPVARGRAEAGRLGCARCHSGAMPGVNEPPPGPSLADLRGRVSRAWLLKWLEDPAKVHADARMPALFTADRNGFVERWILAEHLLGPGEPTKGAAPAGDHRQGRLAFVSLGCAACHQVPDLRGGQEDMGRTPLRGLADRMRPEDLAAFLANPHGRYPDGRMPRLPVAPATGRDIAAYLLMWSKATEPPAAAPPTPQEVAATVRRLRARDGAGAAATLIRERGCASCHVGLGATSPLDVAIKRPESGCLSDRAGVRFALAPETRDALAAYLKVAARERHPSPFAARQRQLERAGCVRCHQRDGDQPPPIEAIGSTLGGAFLMDLPFQRTPRLTNPHQKYLRSYLAAAVREGVSGLRTSRYTYRMPAFGHDAETLVQALAEADGELPAGPDTAAPPPADPTLGSLAGPALAGFQGYACASCHVWDGKLLASPDPGAIGTDLTKVPGRLRRDWFDRFLEDPLRSHPGTPMPAVFTRGKPASLQSVLDGDPAKQRDALWAYFALGKGAPGPQPPPPLAIALPGDGAPLVALIPVRVPEGGTVESITLLYGSDDLILYDLTSGGLHSAWSGAHLLRGVQGRVRTYTVSGTPIIPPGEEKAGVRLLREGKSELPGARTHHGYDRLGDGVRVRSRVQFASGAVEVVESLRIPADGKRRLVRELRLTGVPAGTAVESASPAGDLSGVAVAAETGTAKGAREGTKFVAVLGPDGKGEAVATITYPLPPPRAAPDLKRPQFVDPGRVEGSLERPGYRAVAYSRPKTPAGEDAVMPGAVAVHPRDGRVFVASMKTGELFVLPPPGKGKAPEYRNYAGGLFEEAYSMLAEDDALYVLHRRNLTRVTDADGDGQADRFDRVAALPHSVAEAYDYAYGLARDRGGAFVFSYAPYASRDLPGSGGAVRLVPGKPPREVAFGMRNPLGWVAGPDGEVFFTDNQGEWVATNKLCHVAEGRYYGFPNTAQKQHTTKPAGKAAVWVPYAWARSINGVTYDNTGGKFGPFAGQVFMAELMFGGAVIRANLEKVNGEYQGACFPFWGKGLMGPVSLAFDPRGHLYVGGITEPGWMAQPDRGALYRIDYTGEAPFEVRSIHVRPQGFRLVFTRPVDAATARAAASYHVEHFRYEHTGAYGSPELDRTAAAVRKVEVAADGLSVELTTDPLVRGRVYMIGAPGVRSPAGEALVHPTGAYTLNQIPAQGK